MLTQLLSQMSLHHSPALAPQEGFMADTRAWAPRPIPNVGGAETLSVLDMASALRSVIVESD